MMHLLVIGSIVVSLPLLCRLLLLLLPGIVTSHVIGLGCSGGSGITEFKLPRACLNEK